jgi:hypothetical protein
MESCGRCLAPAVAVWFGLRRLPVSLHSVDFVDVRNIPKAAVDRSGVVRFAWAIGSVRSRRPTGRIFNRQTAEFDPLPNFVRPAAPINTPRPCCASFSAQPA